MENGTAISMFLRDFCSMDTCHAHCSLSSVGQSVGLMSPKSRVQVPYGAIGQAACLPSFFVTGSSPVRSNWTGGMSTILFCHGFKSRTEQLDRRHVYHIFLCPPDRSPTLTHLYHTVWAFLYVLWLASLAICSCNHLHLIVTASR